MNEGRREAPGLRRPRSCPGPPSETTESAAELVVVDDEWTQSLINNTKNTIYIYIYILKRYTITRLNIHKN